MDDGVVTMEDTQAAMWGEYNPDPACQWPVMTVFSSVLPQILPGYPTTGGQETCRATMARLIHNVLFPSAAAAGL